MPGSEIRQRYECGETPIEVLDIPAMDPCGGDDDCNRYWSSCGAIPWYKDPLKRFCTSACCIEWRRQVDRCMPGKVEFDMEERIKRVGLSRIHVALDVALKRNSAFHRSLTDKATQRARRKAKSVANEIIDGEIGTRIDIMNIDLGILYWSSIVSGCPENIYDRALPGDRPGWRSDTIHVKTVRAISLIYSEMTPTNGKQPKLITDLLTLPKFLAALKTRSSRLL